MLFCFHTIRKVKLSKNSIFLTIFLVKSKLSTAKKSKTTTFSRVFHPKIFLTFFLVKSKLSAAKKSKTTTFSRDFHPNFFLTIFLVKSKLSTAKKSKTPTFSRVFHPKESAIFSGNQSWMKERTLHLPEDLFIYFVLFSKLLRIWPKSNDWVD